jgi:FkbM family methyltransferase
MDESERNRLQSEIGQLTERLAVLAQRFNGRPARLYVYNTAIDQLMPLTQTSAGIAARRASGIPSQSGRWWESLRRLLAASGRPLQTIFDIGVNYGYTTAWFATMAEHVIAVEPSPANQALILEHMALRNLRKVELVAAAAGASEGRGVLHLKPFDGHHSMGNIGASETIAVLDVPVVTVDALATARGIDRIDLLKIDVEGFEPDVLDGAHDLLAAGRIDRVVFEFSPAFYRARKIAQTAPIDRLLGFGYRIFDLDGRTVDWPAIAAAGQQADLLALPPVRADAAS